jgi:hypothetical protein
MASLSYVFGAGAMFYQLPPSGLLANAFAGARVWSERQPAVPEPFVFHDGSPEKGTGRLPIDKPERTCDGFTLYTSISPRHFNK